MSVSTGGSSSWYRTPMAVSNWVWTPTPTPTYLGAPTTNFEVDTSGSWEIFGYLGGPHLGGGHIKLIWFLPVKSTKKSVRRVDEI